MTIEKLQNGTELTMKIVGHIDTAAYRELISEFEKSLPGISSLIVDMTDVEYVSSAGLRSLLIAQKTMNKQGTMVVKNPREVVREVFTATGFDRFLTIV